MRYIRRGSTRVTYTICSTTEEILLKFGTDFQNLTAYGAGKVALSSVSPTIYLLSRERNRSPPWLLACPVTIPLVAVTYVEAVTSMLRWTNGISVGGLETVMCEEFP